MNTNAYDVERLNKKRLSPFIVKVTGVILAIIFLAYIQPVEFTQAATTLTVDVLGDGSDTNAGDGICDSAIDPAIQYCSLYAAIQEANALAGHDTINFDTNAIPDGSTISLAEDLPQIDEDLTIEGPGATYLSVDGGNYYNIFVVQPNNDVDISNLTITRSYEFTLHTLNGSNTTVDNVRFINNRGVSGGVQYNDGGYVEITNSLFKDNKSSAIQTHSNGFTYLENSTFNNNGTIRDECKTLYARDSSNILLYNVTMVNSTGGNSTICIDDGSGGASHVNYVYSILVGNQTRLCSIEAGPKSISGEYNILSDSTCDLDVSNLVIPYSNVFTNVLESKVKDNDGDTETFALLYNSQARDYVLDPYCVDKDNSIIDSDQRGKVRSYPIGGQCDIGAYEYSPEYFEGNETACGGSCSVGSAGQDCSFCPPVNITVYPNTLLDGSSISVWEVPSSNYENDFKLGNRMFDISIFDPDNRVITSLNEPLKICIEPTNADLEKTGDNLDNLYIFTQHGGDNWTHLQNTFVEDGYLCAFVSNLSYFTIGVPSLPETGFAPGTLTSLSDLPEQTIEKAYTDYPNISLEIPSLDTNLPVIGVPLTAQGWDVTWLGDRAGYLQGTAFPTWAGNTAITGHVWDADNQPGPFFGLDSLKYGDRVVLHAWGKEHIYEVRDILQVEPDTLSAIPHSDFDMLTLITCKDFDEDSGDYDLRVAVQAVLVDVLE